MDIQKFYLECLSHASYVLSSEGEAVVVDPQRDIGVYLDYLEEHSLRLIYVLETHLHADFISGHLELAEATRATIVISGRARAEFDHIPVDDGSTLKVGTAEIRVLATPGHTPESICYLVEDGGGPMVLFTGDTLFAGDVGRPDLMDETVPAETLAEQLYFSLRDKIMTLPDDTLVYPAHGAGSSCGRDLMNVEYTTVGEQKEINYALQPMGIEEFCQLVIEGQPPAPAYFKLSAAINRRGAPRLETVLDNYREISLEEFMMMASGDDTIVLDVRDEDDFANAHIPGSLHIGLDGRYAEWVGGLLPPSSKILIVSPAGHEEEAAIRCARVGFDSVIGYLQGGFESYASSEMPTRSYQRVDDITTSDLESCTILDIRRPSERALNHISGSIHVPLHSLEKSVELIPQNRPVLIHCAGGYRSVIGASILLNAGFSEVYDLRGGMNSLIERKNKLVTF